MTRRIQNSIAAYGEIVVKTEHGFNIIVDGNRF